MCEKQCDKGWQDGLSGGMGQSVDEEDDKPVDSLGEAEAVSRLASPLLSLPTRRTPKTRHRTRASSETESERVQDVFDATAPKRALGHLGCASLPLPLASDTRSLNPLPFIPFPPHLSSHTKARMNARACRGQIYSGLFG